MAGSMRKMAVYLGLVEDDRYDAYDDDDYAERRDAYGRRSERAVDAGHDDDGYYERADRRTERLDRPADRHLDRNLDRSLDRDDRELDRRADRAGERSVTMLRGEEAPRVRPRVAAGGEDLAAVTPMPALSERRPSGSTAMSAGTAPLSDRAGANGSAGYGPAVAATGQPAPAAPGQLAATGGDVSSITTIHPRTYNEAKAIGERFREGTPVIMNLTEMDDRDAKRLVDFAAGLVFGLHGTIERVTSKVFLLSPVNVTVTAEDKARMAEGKFFNQS